MRESFKKAKVKTFTDQSRTASQQFVVKITMANLHYLLLKPFELGCWFFAGIDQQINYKKTNQQRQKE